MGPSPPAGPGGRARAVAALGWSREPGAPGLFYEAGGTDPETVEERVETGLAAGRELRDWAFGEGGRRAVRAEASDDAHATAVAAYGESTPLP